MEQDMVRWVKCKHLLRPGENSLRLGAQTEVPKWVDNKIDSQAAAEEALHKKT